MAIIKQYNRKFNITYVYESESYWDPDKKQSRSKRKLLGRLDPETGEIIPTGGRGRKPKNPESSSPTVNPDSNKAIQKEQDDRQQQICELTVTVSKLKDELAQAKAENQQLRSALGKLKKQLDSCSDTCSNALN
ncbi:MAG: hypothetical protein LUH03_00125 [Oscillospiraceae bacterium]|nr:hypothetical protein [Oscillospiraceae bacterium]